MNKGTIDFRGERTIGMYTYLPGREKGNININNESMMINNKDILLSGKESYGMKIAADFDLEKREQNLVRRNITIYPEMINGADGIITLRKNPDSTKGDLADRAGLLFYNYQSNQTQTASGRFELIGTNENPVQATIKDGGYGFYLKGATITNGIVPGVNAFLDGMFIKDPSVPKLKIGLKDGGTNDIGKTSRWSINIIRGFYCPKY